MIRFLIIFALFFSMQLHADKSEDNFNTWYACMHDMVPWAIEGDQKQILRLLDKGSKAILKNVQEIDSGANTVDRKSSPYEMAASIYGTAFRQLTDYSRYEDAIYDLSKEKELDDLWNSKFVDWQYRKESEQRSAEEEKKRPWWKSKEKPERHCYYQGEHVQTRKEYLEQYPPRKNRIERTFADLYKKEYAKKVKPYLWIIEKEKEYWKLCSNMRDDDGLADFALNDIKNSYEPMWKAEK